LFNGGEDTPWSTAGSNDVLVGDREQVAFLNGEFFAKLNRGRKEKNRGKKILWVRSDCGICINNVVLFTLTPATCFMYWTISVTIIIKISSFECTWWWPCCPLSMKVASYLLPQRGWTNKNRQPFLVFQITQAYHRSVRPIRLSWQISLRIEKERASFDREHSPARQPCSCRPNSGIWNGVVSMISEIPYSAHTIQVSLFYISYHKKAKLIHTYSSRL
jgi:hypothetical protein